MDSDSPDAPQADVSAPADDAPETVDPAPAAEPDPAPIPDPEPVSVPSSTAPAPPDPIPPAAPQAPQPAAPPFDPHSAGEIGFLRTVLGPRAWAAHRARRQAKLERLMAMAHAKGRPIDRTDVRLLLDVSAPTATRYLSALVRQGRLVRRHTQDDNVYEVVG